MSDSVPVDPNVGLIQWDTTAAAAAEVVDITTSFSQSLHVSALTRGAEWNSFGQGTQAIFTCLWPVRAVRGLCAKYRSYKFQ